MGNNRAFSKIAHAWSFLRDQAGGFPVFAGGNNTSGGVFVYERHNFLFLLDFLLFEFRLHGDAQNVLSSDDFALSFP